MMKWCRARSLEMTVKRVAEDGPVDRKSDHQIEVEERHVERQLHQSLASVDPQRHGRAGDACCDEQVR